MQKHTKVYLDFFDYFDEFIPCEMCSSKATDVHHLTKRSKFGSKQERDYIENLICLCRSCHTKCHSDKNYNLKARIINLENIADKLKDELDG